MRETDSLRESAACSSVLIVEDQDSLRRLLVSFLCRHGIRVFDAGDAAGALSIVHQQRGKIDLAVVDMVMPGKSGLDLATDLMRDYPGIRILYISGHAASVAMDVIARRSPNAVLLKPFTEQALVERVNLLLKLPPGVEPDVRSN
jgi:DNA-binding response OmpR family regulator